MSLNVMDQQFVVFPFSKIFSYKMKLINKCHKVWIRLNGYFYLKDTNQKSLQTVWLHLLNILEEALL